MAFIECKILKTKIMKRISILFIINLLFFCAFAQNPLVEFQRKAHNAFLQYTDKQQHKQVKANKMPMSYSIDDTTYFWRWDLSVMPPTWVYEQAVCKAVGNQSYVFVSVDQWNVNIDSADIEIIMSFLEDSTLNTTEYGIISMDTMLFGQIPDELDNDPKVIFYFTDLESFNGTVFDGYFSEYNQMTESEAQQDDAHSNECEMLYMSCYPVNPSATSTLSVLSHELQHLIHWGYDTDEETWLNEGCSELAMVNFGYPDPIVDFNTNPNNNLIEWEQTFSDYVQVQLFFTYLYEQFGADFIKSIVENPNNGISSINEVFSDFGYSVNFDSVFNDWTLANFINDTNVFAGKYGYHLLQLPNFSYTDKSQSSLPLQISSSLNNCASRYYKLPILDNQQFSFNFENPDHWDLNMLFYDENDSLVEINPVDILQTYLLLENEYSIDKIFLTLSNNFEGTGTDAYVINDTLLTTNLRSKFDDDFSLTKNNDFLNILLPAQKCDYADLKIFSLNGQLVYSNKYFLHKKLNSLQVPVYQLPTGIFLLNITTTEKNYFAKFFNKN